VSALDDFREKLRNVKPTNNGFRASCPVPGHGRRRGDVNPSLDFGTNPEGKVWFACRAGCQDEEVLEAMSLGFADLYERNGHSKKNGSRKPSASWEIKDEYGEVQAIHVRFDRENGDKDCFWKLPGEKKWGLKGRKLDALPLYRCERLKDRPEDVPVVVVEGEKAADALAEVYPDVVGTVTGASETPGQEALAVLRDRLIVLWPDNDDPGRAHMQRVAQRLGGIAKEVRVYEPEGTPDKGDAADHPAVHNNDPATLLVEWTKAPKVEPEPEAAVPFDPEDPRGLTAALADAVTRRHHFARDVGGLLYVYKDGRYVPEGERIIGTGIKRILAESNASVKWSTHRVREVTAYIRTDAPELWPTPPADWVNVLNGILDLESGELLPHTPDFLSPVRIPVEFDASAECPAWDEFVGEVFPHDAQDLAYEIPGWLMVPDTSIQKAVLLTGEGGNGKSTYLTAVHAFVGEENTTNLSLHKIETDRFAASRLIGKLANICPDLPSDHLTSTSTFKAITGGDWIHAEYKYHGGFDFKPFSRLVFSANNPPRSSDASYAFYRRWLVVPFDRTFGQSEQVPREVLDARLADPKELSGVLNKALAALRRLRKTSEFSESTSTHEALADFRITTDPFSVWLDRNTVVGPEAIVGQDELRRAYNEFAEDTGKPGMQPQAFGRAITRARPDVQRSQRMYKGEPNVRVYVGIGLRSGVGEDL